MSERAMRLGLQIRRELGELVGRAVKDPRVQAAALVTVTHVRVSDDLGVARVHVSVIGGEPAEVIRALGGARGFLRGELGRRLRAKKIPELRFVLDDTEARAERIESILREIEHEPTVGESTLAGEGARAGVGDAGASTGDAAADRASTGAAAGRTSTGDVAGRSRMGEAASGAGDHDHASDAVSSDGGGRDGDVHIVDVHDHNMCGGGECSYDAHDLDAPAIGAHAADGARDHDADAGRDPA